MREVLFELRDIEMSYGDRVALQVPSLEVNKGETLTLVGHNGSGKSTLLRTLSLLEPPTRGTMYFDGELIGRRQASLLPLRRRMAAVLQEPLLCRMSVYQNVALGLHFRRVPKAEIEPRVMNWLGRLHIDHLRDRQAKQVSGGEAQRTSLARAMVLEPELLLLDEPFSALDPLTREELLAELQQILAETRTTTVFATHDRGEAMALGDRVAVLHEGRIAQLDQAEEVFVRPRSEEVARFVGVSTLFPGKITDEHDGLVVVDTGFSSLEVAGSGRAGDHVLICLRPEDVSLATSDQMPKTSARNTLRGQVRRILPSDTHFRVEVDCGVPVVALVSRPSFRELGIALGEPALVSFKATAAHVIPRPEASSG